MAKTTLTSKGQVTIPKSIRDRLGLDAGDRLDFRIDAEGRIVVERDTREALGRIPGLLQHLARDEPVTIEEMDEAIRRRARGTRTTNAR